MSLDLLDNLTLEKTVAELKKELEKSQESEGALKGKVEELKNLEELPAKVDDLLRQVSVYVLPAIILALVYSAPKVLVPLAKVGHKIYLKGSG